MLSKPYFRCTCSKCSRTWESEPIPAKERSIGSRINTWLNSGVANLNSGISGVGTAGQRLARQEILKAGAPRSCPFCSSPNIKWDFIS